MDRLLKRKLANRLVKAVRSGKSAEKAELDIFLKGALNTFGIALKTKRPAEIFRILLYACHEGCSISMAIKKLSLDERLEVYSNKTILDTLASIPIEFVVSFAQEMRQIVLRAAIWLGLHPRQVVIAIDDHDIPFYGDKNTPEAVGTKRKNSTNYAYQFMTASIVLEGARFTLGVIPHHGLITKVMALGCLLQQIEDSGIHPSIFLLDRGFNGINFQDVLGKRKWIMPLIDNKKLSAQVKSFCLQAGEMRLFQYTFYEDRAEEYRRTVHAIAKRLEDSTRKCCNTLSSRRHDVSCTVYGVRNHRTRKRRKAPRRDWIYCFMTNIREVPTLALSQIIRTYDFRFGIESSYRVKNGFRPMTTSKRYAIRCWLTCVSFLLMDLWVLVNFSALARSGHKLRNANVSDDIISILEAWSAPGFAIHLALEAVRHRDRMVRAILDTLKAFAA